MKFSFIASTFIVLTFNLVSWCAHQGLIYGLRPTSSLEEQLFRALDSYQYSYWRSSSWDKREYNGQENIALVDSSLRAGANYNDLFAENHKPFLYGAPCHNLFFLAIMKGLPYVKLFLECERRKDPAKLDKFLNRQQAASCPLAEACLIQAKRINARNPEVMPVEEHTAIVKLFLDNGAEPNCLFEPGSRRGITPLIYLLTAQCLRLEPLTTNSDLQFASLAASPNYLQVLEEVLKHPKTKINQPDFEQPESFPDYYFHPWAMTKWDERNHNPRDFKYFSGIKKTPLMYVVEEASNFQAAVAQGDRTSCKTNPFIPIIQLMFKYGADAAFNDHQGRTALYYASFQQYHADNAARPIRQLLHACEIQKATHLPEAYASLCSEYLDPAENDSIREVAKREFMP